MLEYTSFLASWKKPNQKLFKIREMRTHLRRDVAQKSGPTPNRDQLRVFYNADEKTDYILTFFNYYRKVHSTAILTSRGTTFLGDVAPKMCSHFMNFKYFWFGFLQNARKYNEATDFQSNGASLTICQTGRGKVIEPPYMCCNKELYWTASSYEERPE